MGQAVVVRRVFALGDVIFTEPVVRGLHAAGYGPIHVEAEQMQPVFDNHPLVSHGPPPDGHVRFDLTGVYEKAFPQVPVVQGYLDHVGAVLPADQHLPKLWLTADEVDWGRRNLGPGRWLVMDPGYATGRQFLLPPTQRQLVDAVRMAGFRVLLLGKHSREEFAADLDMRHKTTLREMFGLVAASEFFLGFDSGPLNVAQAVGTPGVGLYSERFPPRLLHYSPSVIPIVGAGDRKKFDMGMVMNACAAHPAWAGPGAIPLA